jgi:hypothetical protein
MRIAPEQLAAVRATGVSFTQAVEEGLQWWLERQKRRLQQQPLAQQIAQQGDLDPKEIQILRDIEGALAAARRLLASEEAHAGQQYAKLSKRIERRKTEERRAAQRETRRQHRVNAVSELSSQAD